MLENIILSLMEYFYLILETMISLVVVYIVELSFIRKENIIDDWHVDVDEKIKIVIDDWGCSIPFSNKCRVWAFTIL